jgi:hypothetical protein
MENLVNPTIKYNIIVIMLHLKLQLFYTITAEMSI